MIIGAFFSIWLQQFLQRPKLKINGSGSGGGPAPFHHSTNVTVWNPPALIGFRFPETIVRRLHRDFRLGLHFDRGIARNCTALLWDAETNQPAATLQWRVNGQIKSAVDLEPGQSAELMLFARLADDPTRYFAFQSADLTGAILVPDETARASSTRKFIVEIRHSYDAKKRFKVKVVKGFDGRLRCETPGGWSTF